MTFETGELLMELGIVSLKKRYILVIYCHVINYLKIEQLETTAFIISQFLRVRNLGTA